MYRKLERSEGKVVGIELGEEFTEADMESLETELDGVIAEHGGVRLLVRFEDIPRPELEALVENTTYWLEHREEFERYAVVSGGTLAEWVAELEDAVLGTDIRQFDPEEEDAAWEWLGEYT